ncbi:MAG TPA: hypothetical protein VMR37_05010 [Rhabdochlamydiaceae bacterium]|nr:hypothetical protein [Rhabdochlamydiaceae bacterium]
MNRKIFRFSMMLLLPASIFVGSFPADLMLKERYVYACRQHTDINEHVPVLRSLARECCSVVEVELGPMVSTWGILQGLGESSCASPSYLGIAREPPSQLLSVKALADASGISFKFLQGSALTIDIEPADMLFLDSLHTYCQLLHELKKFSPKICKYIALHDTSAPWGFTDDDAYKGNYAEYPAEYDRSKRGLWAAVEDFLIQHPEWILFEHHFHNHGFTILKRIADSQ